MNNGLLRLTSQQLRRATVIRQRIEKLERELTSLIGIPEPMTVGGFVRRKRKFTAAGRQRIREAMKKRWATFRAAKKAKS